MPYWSLYLQRQLNLTPMLIGQLMAITLVSRIVAPNFWGFIADHTGKHLALVRLCAFMMVLFWIGMFFVEKYWVIALVMMGYCFFQNAILSQFEAVTVAHLGAEREKYGLIRLWGSLGFIVIVSSFGVVFDVISLHWLPLLLAVCALGCWFSSLTVPPITPAHHVRAETSLWNILKRPAVLGFLGANFLLQMSFAPYYTFYSIFLASHHYSYTHIGGLWALGGCSELLAFMLMHRILPKLGARRILLGALILTAFRWWGIGQGVNHLEVLILLQLLNAVSFAAFHSACICLIHQHFGNGHQGQGQALYSMLWGLSAALGTYITGQYWGRVDPTVIYSCAAILCLMGWLWVYAMVRNPEHRLVLATAR